MAPAIRLPKEAMRKSAKKRVEQMNLKHFLSRSIVDFQTKNERLKSRMEMGIVNSNFQQIP